MLAIGRIIWSVRLIIINKICDFPFSPIEKARKEEGGRQGEKEKGQKNFSQHILFLSVTNSTDTDVKTVAER